MTMTDIDQIEAFEDELTCMNCGVEAIVPFEHNGASFHLIYGRAPIGMPLRKALKWGLFVNATRASVSQRQRLTDCDTSIRQTCLPLFELITERLIEESRRLIGLAECAIDRHTEMQPRLRAKLATLADLVQHRNSDGS